jgi:hypothetical protein
MASDEQPAAPSISQHLDELTKGIKELQHLDQLKKCIRELERKGEEAEKRIKELERKGEEAEKRNKEHKGDETETKPKEASIQRATQNADLSTWKSHVTFERRLLDVNAGTYKTETMEATEDIDDALGGLFRGAAEKSIRILLNQEEQSVDLHIEKMKKDSWLFDTFLKEIPDLQRYQNVQVGNASIRLRPPYAPLYHNKELLQKISAELKPLDQKKKEQLDALLRLFEYDWLKKYHDGNMYHDGNIDHTVKFSELWRIYKPGSLVVVSALRKHQVVRKIVSSHTPGEDDSPQEFAVVCTEISHDGKEFGEREVAVIQDAFSGSKRVADLEARPLDLYPAAQKKEIRKNLIKRGEYWYKIYAKPEVKVMSYRGNCVSLSKILEAFRNDRVAEFQGMHSVSRIEGETFMSQVSRATMFVLVVANLC